MKEFFVKIILRLTHRIWNRRIVGLLSGAYMDKKINSHQLHELAAMFDPTQDHKVYKA